MYSRSGRIVGRIDGNQVFGTNGRYVGVYRSTDSAVIKSVFSASNRAGTGKANHGGSGIWGDEPNIPD